MFIGEIVDERGDAVAFVIGVDANGKIHYPVTIMLGQGVLKQFAKPTLAKEPVFNTDRVTMLRLAA
jgi:hypothetical protein